MIVRQHNKHKINAEAQAFDRQAEERATMGLVPDVRRLRKVEGLYNNPWREPEIFNLQILPRIQFFLDSTLPRKGKVLEVGCGTGFLSLELARHGMDVLGIDISPKSIEIAHQVAASNLFTKGFGTVEYAVVDFLAAEFKPNQFDSVCFMGALHHFSNVEDVLEKVAKLLKRKGNLVLFEPVTANFTRASAELASLLRAVCPTWQPYSEKLPALCDAESWKKYVTGIMLEYTYKDAGGENIQSPMDNVTNSEEVMVSAVQKQFNIQKYVKTDAFIDKLIGGLRGSDSHILARFLKFFDDYVIEKGLFPHTNILLHAIKAEAKRNSDDMIVPKEALKW